MSNNFEKFIKNVIKNPNFLILKSEENLLILGIKLSFVERVINNNDVFKPPINFFYNRKWPVFFLVTSKLTLSEMERMFARNGLPILNLAKEKNMTFTEKGINEVLEKFIKEKFGNENDDYTVN